MHQDAYKNAKALSVNATITAQKGDRNIKENCNIAHKDRCTLMPTATLTTHPKSTTSMYACMSMQEHVLFKLKAAIIQSCYLCKDS